MEHRMARRDFTLDGRSDVLWRNADGRLGYWDFEGAGTASFVALPQVADGRYAIRATGDFVGNGQADIAFGFTIDPGTPGEITATGFWRLSGGQPTLFESMLASAVTGAFPIPDIITGFRFEVLRTDNANFNGDRYSDLLLIRQDAPQLYIYYADLGQFTASLGILDYDPSFAVQGASDFNADGTTDILWRNTATGELGIWSMSQAKPFAWTSLGVVTLNYQVAKVGDFNGDGRGDILWTTTRADGGIGVGTWTITGSGSSYAATWRDLGAVYGTWSVAAIGDYTGDGSEDILWRNTTTGENLIWDFEGGVVARAILAPTVASDWSVVA
jgi:hypothetical protein